MNPLTDHARSLIAQINDQGITDLELQFTDVTGINKAVQIPVRQVESAVRDGVWFDGSAIEGFARVAELDMYLRPDPTTLAELPWDSGDSTGRKVGRLICDVYQPNGEPFPGDPRYVLRRAVEAAAQQGYRYVVAPELEFFLLRQPITLSALQTDDKASYFDSSETESNDFRRDVSAVLEQMGITIESHHHEVGYGQHELDLGARDALSMADAIMTARFVIKAMARRYKLHATFMPKPMARVAGSGMHVHQTLVEASDERNVFADPEADYGLSEIARGFLAGQLAHARGMCAVLAPLVNSYKRLVAGLEAPVYVTWAQTNRSALIRVPRLRPDHPNAARLELRCVDPSCNPYLAFAVMLRAGLDGIAQRMELPNPSEEEVYQQNARRRQLPMLPISLHEALDQLEEDDLIIEALGLNAFERFHDAKRLEWDQYALEVSPWELERYLMMY